MTYGCRIKNITVLEFCANNYWIQKAWIAINAIYFMSIMWKQTSKPCRLYINAVDSQCLPFKFTDCLRMFKQSTPDLWPRDNTNPQTLDLWLRYFNGRGYTVVHKWPYITYKGRCWLFSLLFSTGSHFSW